MQLNMQTCIQFLGLGELYEEGQTALRFKEAKIKITGHGNLRILASYEAKTAKISNPIKRLFVQRSKDVKSAVTLHLWSVGQKGFLSDFEKMVY